jgi:hypothetical protein
LPPMNYRHRLATSPPPDKTDSDKADPRARRHRRRKPKK